MDLEGEILDLEGTLLHSLPKVGAISPLVPVSYVPGNNLISHFKKLIKSNLHHLSLSLLFYLRISRKMLRLRSK